MFLLAWQGWTRMEESKKRGRVRSDKMLFMVVHALCACFLYASLLSLSRLFTSDVRVIVAAFYFGEDTLDSCMADFVRRKSECRFEVRLLTLPYPVSLVLFCATNLTINQKCDRHFPNTSRIFGPFIPRKVSRKNSVAMLGMVPTPGPGSLVCKNDLSWRRTFYVSLSGSPCLTRIMKLGPRNTWAVLHTRMVHVESNRRVDKLVSSYAPYS